MARLITPNPMMFLDRLTQTFLGVSAGSVLEPGFSIEHRAQSARDKARGIVRVTVHYEHYDVVENKITKYKTKIRIKRKMVGGRYGE